MKKCIYCGQELPADASWCPYCEKAQDQTEEVKTPVRKRRLLIACTAFVLLLVTGGILLYRYHSPKVYEGGSSLDYRINGKNCRVLLSFDSDAGLTGNSMDQVTGQELPGNASAFPSQLFAWSADDPAIMDAFISEVESCQVTAKPQDGAAAMDVYGPVLGSESGFSNAAWKADIVYSTDCATNIICWEIRMKNRDILRLYQTITCEALPCIDYHFEDTPMETVEQISALIKKTAEEETPETVLRLFLPPVTYEGTLVMDERTAVLFGSEEDGKKTTFTDTIEIRTRKPMIAEFYDLEFQGDGGTGIISRDALRLQACLFTGWDIGVDAQEGAWVSINNCAMVGNGTGFRFDSHLSTFSNETYENVVFAENGIGMQICNVPGNATLQFYGTVFDANTVDLEDPKGRVNLN